jgi:P pilus assembly chaperone PapD
MSIPKPVRFSGILNVSGLRSVMIFFALFSGFVFCTNTDAYAQGNLLITPRRVLFEGSRKSMDVNLANTGNDSATYAITLVQIRMKDDGGFENITEPDPEQNFADKNLRFFPRQVTLAPGESQSIKVQVIKASDLKPGEYRSHFYFRAVPKQSALGEKTAIADSTSISIKITPIFGITIPAIIRVGGSNTKVALSDLSFKYVNDTIPTIGFTFNRTGNMSVYGDITVEYTGLNGKSTKVGTANGVAVYTPNALRKFQVILKSLPDIDYKAGTLRVIYSAPSDVKPMRFAEAELTLKQ